MCVDTGNVRCVAVWIFSFVLLDGTGFVGLLHLLRVACVVGVAIREGQVVCCCLGVEKEIFRKL
jgi:hypothetical protein